MDSLMLIIFGIILVLCIIFAIYITLYNKIQNYTIRINEAESIIDNNLRDKYDNINKSVSLIKGNETINKEIDKKMFEEIVKLRNKKISNFDLDRKLIEANNNFITLKEKYKEFKEHEDVIKITNKITEIDENLIINRDYYNKNIAEYNKLIALFPTNIIAKIYKYEEKLFFDKKDMSDNDYNDFKL